MLGASLPLPSPDGATPKPSHPLNGMVASSAWWLSLNYSGSILSWLSRYFNRMYCNWLIAGTTGIWGNIKWFFVCMKAEEDVASYAYSNSNSQYALALLAATGAYWITHRFQRFWYSSNNSTRDESTNEHNLAQRLDAIEENLHALTQDKSKLILHNQALSLQLLSTQQKLEESENRLRELQTTLLEQISEDEKEFSETIAGVKKRLNLV